jgi:hypothetical protein
MYEYIYRLQIKWSFNKKKTWDYRTDLVCRAFTFGQLPVGKASIADMTNLESLCSSPNRSKVWATFPLVLVLRSEECRQAISTFSANIEHSKHYHHARWPTLQFFTGANWSVQIFKRLTLETVLRINRNNLRCHKIGGKKFILLQGRF